jgi:hypothetical protein
MVRKQGTAKGTPKRGTTKTSKPKEGGRKQGAPRKKK